MAIADRIVAHLKACDIEPLIDRESLRWGLEWQRGIVSSIRRANYVLWLVSERSINSRYSRWELSVQSYFNKGLFPVAVSDNLPKDLPKSIAKLQMLMLDGSGDVEKQVRGIAKTLLAPAEWVKQHTWLEDRAQMAKSRLRGAELIAAEKWLLDQS